MQNQITSLTSHEEKKHSHITGMDPQTEKLMLEVMKQEDIEKGDRSLPGHMFPTYFEIRPEYARKKSKSKVSFK